MFGIPRNSIYIFIPLLISLQSNYTIRNITFYPRAYYWSGFLWYIKELLKINLNITNKFQFYFWRLYYDKYYSYSFYSAISLERDAFSRRPRCKNVINFFKSSIVVLYSIHYCSFYFYKRPPLFFLSLVIYMYFQFYARDKRN